MANHHLRNRELSLKAKGLLSLMLSLPEDWDYTTKGLSCICKDGVDSICATIKELEKAGYVKRRRLRDAQGRLSDLEYTILEKPEPLPSPPESPQRENPVVVKPDVVEPDVDSPELGKPHTENPAQLSIQEVNKQESITGQSNTHSFFPAGAPAEGQKDALDEREKIKHQIEYDWLREQFRAEPIDELVEIMLEVAMNRSPTSLFAGIFPSVTGNKFIAAFRAGAGNGRDKNTVLADAFLQLLHGRIVTHGEGILRVRVKLG